MVGEDYLEHLNPAQRSAVVHSGSPELVIAGAGSGKTRVLTYKIVYLLRNGFNPARILALTFTNKAAREMRERISSLVGEETASRLWMGTFHSIFCRILRRHADKIGFKSNFTVYDASDSKSLVRTIIKELRLDDKDYRPGKIASEISWAKNQLISPEAYAADAALVANDKSARRERLHEIYKIYRDRCRIAGAMDFDDLLYYTNVLLRDNTDILKDYREYFSYILVDEYQDTNFAQHRIVRELCGDSPNLCVVGDDAQSIYSFRGANVRNILDLGKWFPGLAEYKLEQNYRSTRNILGAANSLIAANKDQIEKEIFSENEDGDKIELVETCSEFEEANTVASRLALVRRKLGMSYNDTAILYRTNAQSRVLEEALRNRNIPYRIYGGLAFYQRKEIKDAVSYFRLSVNPDDDEALTRVINTPKRGIGETTVGKVRAAAIAAGASMYAVMCDPAKYSVDVNKGTLAKLEKFGDTIKRIVEKATIATADEAADFIVASTGLMQEYLSGDTPECISKRENLLELLNGVKEYTERNFSDGAQVTMNDYLSEISLMTDQDESDEGDSVTLMTIHSAKGLEFGAVFIVGAEEKLLPSEKCSKESEIEEERRLMYVAITRAKKFCMISYATRRMQNGETRNTMPSRFIQDISPRFLRPVMGTARPAYRNRYSEKRIPDTVRFTRQETDQAPRSIFTRPSIEETKVHPTIGASPAPTPSSSPGEYTVHTSAELSAGQNIMHNAFGHGTIENVDTTRPDHRIIVQFHDGSKRTLLLKFARFKLLS